jgi:hypothetical protein
MEPDEAGRRVSRLLHAAVEEARLSLEPPVRLSDRVMSRRRVRIAIAAAIGMASIVGVVVGGLAVADAVGGGGGRPDQATAQPSARPSTATPSVTSTSAGPPYSRCPTSTLTFAGDWRSRAQTAARAYVGRQIGYSMVDTSGFRIAHTSVASADKAYGPIVASTCGQDVARRVAVVQLEFPHQQGADLSYGVLFIARTASGFAVYQQFH